VPPITLPEEEMEKLLEAKRQQMPSLAVEERLKGFTEVELGYSAEQAIAEAKRCLRCDRMEE
jgi:hypothetical protein